MKTYLERLNKLNEEAAIDIRVFMADKESFTPHWKSVEVNQRYIHSINKEASLEIYVLAGSDKRQYYLFEFEGDDLLKLADYLNKQSLCATTASK